PLAPVPAAGAVGGIPVPLLPALDHEDAVFDARVLEPRARVVLAFAVADEALLVGPLRGIGRAVAVELVGPDELPSRALRPAVRERRHYESQERSKREPHVERLAEN